MITSSYSLSREHSLVVFWSTGKALVDLMTQSKEKVPEVGSRILCRHSVLENKRAWVSPSKIENLYKVYWKDGKVHIIGTDRTILD